MAASRSPIDDGILLIPMLGFRVPRLGRMGGVWRVRASRAALSFGRQLGRVWLDGGLIKYLEPRLAELSTLEGIATGVPASTDDWREVGGSTGTAKSRAAVPGCGPRKPSFTPSVLELSPGVRLE